MNTAFVQLRSAIYYVGLGVVTIVFGLTLSLVGWTLPLRARFRLTRDWALSNLWMLRVLCRLDYDLHGREHLPDGPAIVMSKHQSAWETIALRGLVRLEQSWVLKKELMAIPFFGWSLALDRKSVV